MKNFQADSMNSLPLHAQTLSIKQPIATVLIVDDSESDRVIYSRYLQSDSEQTYCIIEAETLEEGLELWRSQQPDIMLIDLNLPDGEGLEFLEAIKIERAAESAPVIMLTGQGNEKKAVQAMKLGAADYLVKGDITAKLLTVTIRQILRETALGQQLLRSQQQQALISAIALRIREFLNLEDISNAIVKEVRQFIKADRATIYKFNPADMSGKIVAEDIVSPWQPCLNVQVQDTCFRENLGGAYCEGRIFAANDIYAANLTACHIKLLERFQVRANLVVPILLPNANKKSTLWGLLIIHQCSAPRVWLESDIQLLQQLSVQIAIAIKQAIAYQQIHNELTKRKRVEQELLELNQLLETKVIERTQELWQVNQLQRAILDGTDYAIIQTDAKGFIQTFNAGAEKMLGYSKEEVVGRFTPTIFEDPQEMSNRIAQTSKILGKDIGTGFEALRFIMSRYGSIYEEWINIRKDGSRFPASVSVALLKDDNEQIIGSVSVRKDISDRKQVEKALQESKTLLQTVLDTFPLSVFWKDLESVYMGCNQLFAHTTGLNSVQDIIGKTDLDFSNSEAQVLAYRADDLQVMESGIAKINFEEMFTKPTGEQIWVQTNKIPLRNTEGNVIGVMGTFQDISDRKQAELQLKKTSDRLALALSSGAIGYWEFNIQQNYLVWDDRMYEMYGKLRETNSPITYATWISSLHPDDRHATETLLQQAVLELAEYDCEFRVIHPDRSIHFIKAYGKVEKNAQGKAQSMIGVNFDISDRKQAEIQLKLANQELLRATNLKDEFLANMSHELRTPLNSILGLSEALKDGILGSINNKQLNAISTVESSGEHLLSLINDILDLSKISSGMMALDIEGVSVHNLCDSSLTFVKQQAFQKSIQLTINIPPIINNINIDERRIKQVLINLLTNSVKFTPNGGNVSLIVAVGSSNTWQGEAKIPERIKAINSPTILFQVVDTGIGIDSNDLNRLFQPFIQVDSALNREYEGTGLGLALVKKIVELHGGQVMVESEVGQGSFFTVALPYEMSQSNAIASAPTSTTASSQDVNPVNPPLILLAEDNEANIQTFSSYLTAINYRVILARNGVEAIAQAKANLPDIILMDIQMPTMDGLESTRQIRLDPNLISTPIVALTALAMEGDRDRCLAAGMNGYISKPLKLRELARLIAELLVTQ